MTHVVCMVWEGSEVPSQIRIYDGLSGLNVRPFYDTVLQCFRCYSFGHTAKYCRSTPVCIACGEDFHGHCERVLNASTAGKDTSQHTKNAKYMNIIQRLRELWGTKMLHFGKQK